MLAADRSKRTLNVPKHIVPYTPFHGHWLSIFVLNARFTAVTGYSGHFLLELSVEVCLCLLLLGLLRVLF
jgi:hypothetical protein